MTGRLCVLNLTSTSLSIRVGGVPHCPTWGYMKTQLSLQSQRPAPWTATVVETVEMEHASAVMVGQVYHVRTLPSAVSLEHKKNWLSHYLHHIIHTYTHSIHMDGHISIVQKVMAKISPKRGLWATGAGRLHGGIAGTFHWFSKDCIVLIILTRPQQLVPGDVPEMAFASGKTQHVCPRKRLQLGEVPLDILGWLAMYVYIDINV